MSPLGNSTDEFRERFFKNASSSPTPWGIAKNWLLILRMLTVLIGHDLWQNLKCFASIPRAVAPFLFNRRVRQRVSLYQAARQAGPVDTDRALQELVSDVKTALDVEHPTA